MNKRLEECKYTVRTLNLEPLLTSGTVENLYRLINEAESRLFDILLGDDGQAYKEAEKYLERERPDLYEKLKLQQDIKHLNMLNQNTGAE